MSEKVTRKNAIEAVYLVDNSTDTVRSYEISANVRFGTGATTTFDNGIVRPKEGDGMTVTANFASYGEDNLSINFTGVQPSEQQAVNAAVNEFLSECRASASEWTLSE